MPTAEAIRTQIEKIALGEPFTSTQFTGAGRRAAVDQALSRMVKHEQIARLARGVFVRPKTSKYVGQVMPEPAKIAQAIASAHGETLQVQGAEAARLLGLTTQMPMQSVFYTSGPGRKLKVGNLQLVFKHVPSRKLALAGQPSGLALTALWYLGKAHVTPHAIETIREKLSPEAFEQLKAEARSMPGWMAETLHRNEQGGSSV
jgi:hypothetical protein